jgi:hypothetical protein
MNRINGHSVTSPRFSIKLVSWTWDGERVLTILYVSNFAEFPRSVFIRTQNQTSGVIWGP